MRHSAAPLVDLTQIGRPRRHLHIAQETAKPAALGYVLTRAEAAAYLNVSPRMVSSMLADGRLPSFTIGERRLIRRADLEAFVDEACAAAGYHLLLPRTIAEARAAAAQFDAEANRLIRLGQADLEAEEAAASLHAGTAFAIVARWYRRLAGDFLEDK